MTAGKAELVRRLNATGMAPEMCESYFYTLKQFLNAKMTKIEFEDALRAILPPDKVPVHNNLIKEILRASCAKREGTRRDLCNGFVHDMLTIFIHNGIAANCRRFGSACIGAGT